MTPAQRTRLYFPRWNEALAANWVTAKGSSTLIENHPGGVHARQVDTLASQRAASQYRTVKPDDLRHACHVIALGRTKSSKDLTNRELDRLLAFFKILKNEIDLAASVQVQDHTIDERRRYVWAIENAGLPAAYIASVAKATQDCADWRTMTNRQLGLLVATLKNRSAARSNPAPRTLPRTYVLNRRHAHEPV